MRACLPVVTHSLSLPVLNSSTALSGTFSHRIPQAVCTATCKMQTKNNLAANCKIQMKKPPLRSVRRRRSGSTPHCWSFNKYHRWSFNRCRYFEDTRWRNIDHRFTIAATSNCTTAAATVSSFLQQLLHDFSFFLVCATVRRAHYRSTYTCAWTEHALWIAVDWTTDLRQLAQMKSTDHRWSMKNHWSDLATYYFDLLWYTWTTSVTEWQLVRSRIRNRKSASSFFLSLPLFLCGDASKESEQTKIEQIPFCGRGKNQLPLLVDSAHASGLQIPRLAPA